MRILQVLPSLVNGGVEIETLETAKAIIASGGDAFVISNGGPLVSALESLGATHISLPVHSKSPVHIWANISKIQEVIRRYNIDLVHARSRAPAWSSFYAARRENIPFVTTYHGAHGTKGWGKKKYNQIMLKGQRIMVPSHFIKQHLKRNYVFDLSKLRIVPSGIDVTRFNPSLFSQKDRSQQRREWGISDNSKIILMPGRLSRIKGCEVLIEALSELKVRDVSVVFLGATGNSYEQDLKKKIQDLKVGDRVHFVPPSQNMPLAYFASDVVVSASLKPESFGRTIIEAQSMLRPVIATRHGGAMELIDNERTGWLVNPGEPKKLSRALASALNLPEKEQKERALHAQDIVIHCYTSAIMGYKTLKVYKELL